MTASCEVVYVINNNKGVPHVNLLEDLYPIAAARKKH